MGVVLRWRGGGDEGTRTPDPRDANAVLFQLSYIPTGAIAHEAPTGAQSVAEARPTSRPAEAGRTATPRPTDPYARPMPLGLGHGLIAALCWGSTDVMASIAGRRLGSLHVVAVAQLDSVARRDPARGQPGRRPAVRSGRPRPRRCSSA